MIIENPTKKDYQKVITTTKIVVFRNIRDGALLLDEDDRLLFVKAHTLDMGDADHNAKVTHRLMDPNYETQYSFITVAKPKHKLKVKLVDIWEKIYTKLWTSKS